MARHTMPDDGPTLTPPRLPLLTGCLYSVVSLRGLWSWIGLILSMDMTIRNQEASLNSALLRSHQFHPIDQNSAVPLLPWLVGVALVVTLWIQPPPFFFVPFYLLLSLLLPPHVTWILMFGARFRSQADLSLLLFKAFRVKRFPHHSTQLSLASKEEMPELPLPRISSFLDQLGFEHGILLLFFWSFKREMVEYR